MSALLRACLCFGVIAGATGCGEGVKEIELPKTVPVTGTVKLDGKPLAGASVTFMPKGETKGIECSGVSDESGKYTLTQLRGGEGAPPGEYSVVVRLFPKPGQGAMTVQGIPARYSDPQSTTLTATVPQAGGEIPPLELSSK